MTRSLHLLPRRRLAGARDGAVATEFAIIFPLYFLLLFGILEFAHGLWVINTLQYTLGQGTRYAATSSAGPPAAGTCSLGTYEANLQSYLQRQVGAYLTGATVPLPSGICTAGTPPTVTVNLTVSYPFTFILSNLTTWFPHGVTLQQKASVTIPLS
jgi:Flp pilus assembly protein TadG